MITKTMLHVDWILLVLTAIAVVICELAWDSESSEDVVVFG
jgi:hypothetical protein